MNLKSLMQSSGKGRRGSCCLQTVLFSNEGVSGTFILLADITAIMGIITITPLVLLSWIIVALRRIMNF